MRFLGEELFDCFLVNDLGAAAAVTVALAGLSEGFAEIGTPMGVTTSLGRAPDGGMIWSDNPDPGSPAVYGLGPAPFDFAAGDGGSLYLHLTEAGVTYTRSAPIRQPVAPAIESLPVVTGQSVAGMVLTATPGSYTGPALTVAPDWEESSDGTGWTSLTTSGLTSPPLVAGRFYRLSVAVSNTRGAVQAVSAAAGPVTVAATPPALMQAPSLVVDGPTQITLTRAAAPDDGGTPITRYDVRHREVGAPSWTGKTDIGAAHPITGLNPAAEYQVQTRAVNAVGNGSYSPSATAVTTVAAPTVSLTPTSGTITAGSTGTVAMIVFGGGAADTVTLTGPDAALFTRSGTSLELAAAAVVGSYGVTVDVSNATGSDRATFSLTVEEDTSVIIDSVTATSQANGAIQISVAATGAVDGVDTFYIAVESQAVAAPSAQEVKDALTGPGDTASFMSGNNLWPGPITLSVPPDTARGAFVVHTVVDNGFLSIVGASEPLTLDTEKPMLSSLTMVESTGDLIVSVDVTDPNGGTLDDVLFGLRNTATGQLTKTLIQDGGAGVVANDTDSTPSGNTYSVTFPGVAIGDYTCDVFAVDDFGIESDVASSNNITVSSVSPANISHLGAGTTGQPNSTSPISLGLNMSAHDNAQKVLVGMSTMGFNPGGDIALTSITLDGSTAEQIFESRNPDGIAGGSCIAVFPAGAYAASSTLEVNFSRSVWRFNASAYDIGASPTVDLLDTQIFSSTSSYALTGAVSADNSVIAVVGTSNSSAENPTITGATADDELVGNGGNRLNVASATGLLDDATYDVGVTYGTAQGSSALLVRIS